MKVDLLRVDENGVYGSEQFFGGFVENAYESQQERRGPINCILRRCHRLILTNIKGLE